MECRMENLNNVESTNNVNIVLLEGNITSDPVIEYASNNNSIAKLTVAIETFLHKQDGVEKNISYIDIEAWRSKADFIAASTGKGSRIRVIGRLRQSVWKESITNAMRSRVFVIADNIDVLQNKDRPNKAMNCLNSVTLEGIIVNELKTEPSGKNIVTKFTLGVNKSFQKQGKWQNEKHYIDIEAWGEKSDYVIAKASKYSFVRVAGKLKQVTWEDKLTNMKKNRTYVIGEFFEFSPYNSKQNIFTNDDFKNYQYE